jgi:hypothetical protein
MSVEIGKSVKGLLEAIEEKLDKGLVIEVDGVGVLTVPANSGGVILSSGEVVGASLKALARNSGDIYVGGPDNRPYSGYGYCLEPGEAWNIDIQNLNKVALVAVISGDKVTWASLK